MAAGNRNLQRRWDQKAVGNFYTKKFRWIDRCVYCGQNQDCWDHVFPLSLAAQLNLNRPSVRKVLFQGLNMVPACYSCNGIAGAKKFTNILEKRLYIQSVLKKKYRKVLRHIIWDDEEMHELGRNMRDEVIKAMNNRNLMELRVSWPYCRTLTKYRKK